MGYKDEMSFGYSVAKGVKAIVSLFVDVKSNIKKSGIAEDKLDAEDSILAKTELNAQLVCSGLNSYLKEEHIESYISKWAELEEGGLLVIEGFKSELDLAQFLFELSTDASFRRRNKCPNDLLNSFNVVKLHFPDIRLVVTVSSLVAYGEALLGVAKQRNLSDTFELAPEEDKSAKDCIEIINTLRATEVYDEELLKKKKKKWRFW
jgi:hypothetical protein